MHLQSVASIPTEIATPDTIVTPIGTLHFKDGMPDDATAVKAYDHIDAMHAEEAFYNAFAAVNMWAGSSAWLNTLYVGGDNFMSPPPRVTRDGLQPLPDDGARKLNSRIAMFYVATGITPAMVMYLPNVGSAYLGAFVDSKGAPFDGGEVYTINLPKGIPAGIFWSLTAYDNQSRSMLDTPQRFPRAGSQSYPSPAAVPNADGSTTIYFGPEPPEGKTSNWIQTTPGKGWFVLLRLYSPLSSFFDKTWRPGEIERRS